MTSLAEEFMNLLKYHEDGLSDNAVKEHFGSRYPDLASIINDFMDANRLQLYTQAGVLVYKIIKEDTAAKFEGLG